MSRSNPVHRFSWSCLVSFGLLAVVILSSSGCHSATAHNLEGKKLYQQGQYGPALERFQEAVLSDPQHADGYYNLAATYHSMGRQTKNIEQLRQAETLYHQCLEKDPNHADCYRGLTVLLMESGRRNEAFQLLDTWAAGNRQSADAHIELARLHHETGDESTARRQLDLALSKDPRNPRVWNALGYMREKDGDVAQALQNYSLSYRLNDFQPGVAARIAELQQTTNSRLTPLSAGGTRTVDSRSVLGSRP